MLNPLELFLFITFLLYALLYRPLLALIYALLLLAYYRYSKKKALPTSYYEKSKHCYSSPIEPKFFMRVRYDVTDTLAALKRWNSENSTKLTITHVALKALAVGMHNLKSSHGRLPFGNFKPEIGSNIGTVIGVKFGKALVPVRIDNAADKSLEEIQQAMTPVVKLAREQKYKPYDDQMAINKVFPTFLLQVGFTVFGYMCNAMGVALSAFNLRAYDFSTCFFTNVGNYQQNIKLLAFSPLAHFCHQMVIPAMTNAFEEVVVRNNNIERRWIVNLCYAFDSRYLEFDEHFHNFFVKVKENMENPQFD